LCLITINQSIEKHTNLLLFVDGGCEPKNPGGVATSGWALFDPKNLKTSLVEQSAVAQDGGPLATNNYGEYNALLLALSWLAENKWSGELTIKADSKLLVEQISGRWKVKAEHLKPIRDQILSLMNQLNLEQINESSPLPDSQRNACQLIWISRDLNEYANQLCRDAYQRHKNNRP
jgi:ribonuclease HI